MALLLLQPTMMQTSVRTILSTTPIVTDCIWICVATCMAQEVRAQLGATNSYDETTRQLVVSV